MKLAEITLIIVAMIGLGLSIFLIPGGSLLLMISLCGLSMIYFYLGFAFFNDIPLTEILKSESYKGISALRIVGAVFAGVALSTILMGILYKVQSWPGAAVMIGLGLISSLIVGIAAVIKSLSNKSPYYSEIIKRIVAYGVIGLVLFFWSERIFLEFKYRNYPEYVEAVKKSKSEPNNQELRDKVREEREKIDYQR